MKFYNSQLKQTPWANAGKSATDIELLITSSLAYYDGGTSNTGQEPSDSEEETYADKSVIDKMNARRGPGDSTKADSGGGDADKRVVSKDVDSGPVNNDRGA
jgi:hypothetical protein